MAVDISVIGALERNDFSRKDFILTDNYNIRLRPDATKRLIQLVNGQLSSRVSYKNKSWEWRSVIQQKAGVLAVFITSASRLVLGITEALLASHRATYAYCDTDGIGIPPEHVKEVQDYFQRLTPYSFEDKLFKVEKTGTFYGISAKRYVIYEMDRGIPKIIEYKSHGLGHIMNPFTKDGEDNESTPLAKLIWEDILSEHYKLRTEQEIIEKYRDLYAVSKMEITTPGLMHWFAFMNKGKPYPKTIKPFNFMLAGGATVINQKTSTAIKPIASYRKDVRLAPHSEFIDYHSGGEMRRGSHFWKSLEDFYGDYKNHPESKFDGDIGLMQRKHLAIKSKVYIGKEANRLEETSILGVEERDTTRYIDEETHYKQESELNEFISKLTPEVASKSGINRKQLYRLKRRINCGDKLNPYSKTRRRLTRAIKSALKNGHGMSSGSEEAPEDEI